MSENKQPTPTFSFGAPPSENKAASNTFGQPSTTSGNAFGAATTTSSSPFGSFGGPPTTSASSPFGTAFSQGTSAFGAPTNSGSFTLGGTTNAGSGGSIFAQKSDSSGGQPSPSIFNSGATSSSPFLGGALNNAPSGSPFGNLASSQPGNVPAAGLTTPAPNKSTALSFSTFSTTPAGPPPSSANGPMPSSGTPFSFPKPQQNMFGPKNDGQTSTTQPSSAPILMSGSSGDGSKTGLSFGILPARTMPSSAPILMSQTSGGFKPSPTFGQLSGSSSEATGTLSGFGVLGRNDNAQPKPGLFGELRSPNENTTPVTSGSQTGFPAPTLGSATTAQQTANQPDGTPNSTTAVGDPSTDSSSTTSTAQASTFTPAAQSKPAQTAFKFLAATSAGNPSDRVPALAAAKPLPGSFVIKPNVSEPSGSMSAPAGSSAPSAFPPLNTPTEGPTADPTSAAEKTTTTNATATSTSAPPTSTAAEAPTTAETSKTPQTSTAGTQGPSANSAAANGNNAKAAPAAPAAPNAAADHGAPNAGPAPPPQSRLKNKSMEEIITSWAKDLGDYQKEFQKQADKIASWDQLIVENGDKIQKLYVSTFEAERASSEVERQLSAVVGQQDELSGWLDRYEKEVDEIFSRQVGQGEGLQGPDQDRERTYKLAEKLSDRLDEMGKDLKNMIEDINSASLTLNKTNKPDDPLSQIVKVLNSHLASLQWIDQNAAAIQAKVSAAQKVGQGMSTNGHRGLGEDAVDDFYKSYLGRR